MTSFALFDLDNTLVDSLHLKPLRDRRRWVDVYAAIGTITVFRGIGELWTELRRRGIYVGVVTHSPRAYATRVLAHAALEPDKLVAYHDLAGRLKPSPFGYERCADGRPPGCGVAVGDELHDLRAADAFGCPGAYAAWAKHASLSSDDCARAGWTYAATPADLLPLIACVGQTPP